MINKNNAIRTAEWVRVGHPDRICDILADSLLDEFLKQDPESRVALEVFGCHGIITVGGEITTKGYVDIPKIVKQVYKEIGYKDEIGVQVNISRQSPEISQLANKGAGDSGIVIGYATNETKEMLPKEVVIAKQICDWLDNWKWGNLYPDGKVQVSMKEDEIVDLVVSVQGEIDATINEENLESFLKVAISEKFHSKKLHLTVFQKGGFEADTGLTGRKNILWYGPRIPTGGGAFAGKDATKVDRSGAYAARQIAIQWLKDGKMKECLVEIAFVIGEKKSISCKINGEELEEGLNIDGIIKKLDLKKPIFRQASLLGHFGNKMFPWEK